jgi:diguanylate cyclase (GGDEF)-like protein/PAS domain S-box-containing protein
MSVEPDAACRGTEPEAAPFPWVLVLLAPVVGTAVIGAALTGLVPPLLAIGLGAGASGAVHGTLLIRLSLRTHHRLRSFGPCRGVGFVSLGVVISGAAASAAAFGRAGWVAGAGLALAVAAYLAGMLLLPGTVPTFVARLRQSLDGVGLAACFLFTAWVVAIAPHGGSPARLPLVVTIAEDAIVAGTVVIGMRAVRYRSAARACAAGAVVSCLGLGILALALAGTAPAAWLYLGGTALVYGPLISYAVARRYAGALPEPEQGEPDSDFGGYPVLTLPIAMVLAAALYHLVTAHTFDLFSAGLGCAVVAALTAREAFGTFDVRRYTRQIVVQEAHFRSLVAGASEVAMVLHTDLTVRWQSPAAARQLGLSDQDVVGRSFLARVHPDDRDKVRERLAVVLAEPTAELSRAVLIEARLRDGFGHWRDTESSVSDLRAAPEVGALVIHVRDVGERRELERRMHRLASTDQLTGLANRKELLHRLSDLRGKPGGSGAVLVIDLDGFTAVNDVRGHDAGDAVLVEAARRIRDAVDGDDLPARLSGDEFAIATTGSPVHTYALASRVLTVLSQPYPLPAATVHLTACVGIAELSGTDSGGDALSRAALALRRARHGAPGRVEWYDEALEAALLHRMTLEQDLHGAIGRGELDLVYQPIIDLVEGRPVGAEALLRWRHPVLGTIAAADFVPVAEDIGLINEIGEWVVHRVCRLLSTWRHDGRDLWIALHLARRQLAASSVASIVRSALELHQVPAERLLLEVAESALGSDTDHAVEQLTALRTLGVRTALTRFGTGTTPMTYLRKLPVDLLKVDRSTFAEPVARTAPAPPSLDVIVGLSRRLGLEVMAGGLEAEAHLDVVRTAGCRYGQGYLFGRPVPAEHLEAFLESHRSAS